MSTPAPVQDAVSADAIWREMRLHMEWNDALSLCFLFTPDARAVAPVAKWTSDAWALRSAPLMVLSPAEPAHAAQEVLQGLQQQVQARSMARGPVWVYLVKLGDSNQTSWDSARSDVLARLNEAREWLVQSFARPLVLCMPLAWRSQVALLAPDLWHIRSYSAQVQAVVMNVLPSKLAGPETRTLDAFSQRQLEPVRVQLQLARERLAASPSVLNLQRELGIALDTWGDALSETGNSTEALAVYRESLDIRRQLRQALGETPQVLRDLSISLDNVGGAENDAGHGQEALAVYRESLDIRRQLRQALGETPQVLRDLSVSLNNVGRAENDVGHGQEALAVYRESLDICRQLRQALGETPQVLRDLSVSLNNVGRAENDAGHGQEALAAYRESLAIRQRLRQALGDTPQVMRDLAYSLEKVGSFNGE